MKVRRLYVMLVFAAMLYAFPAHAQSTCAYVNPFIGSSNFGTTNPGAVVPRGMVSVVPFNVSGSATNKWDKDLRWWSTPYSWENTYFTGYSHINLSGVGCPDLGVILLMPISGGLSAKNTEYGSPMSRQKASPGYYSCYLDKYNIQTEVTATQRSGLSKFIFPEGDAHILIDLGNGLTNETGGSLRIVNECEVEGSRMVGNFCYHGNSERTVYFVARFSEVPKTYGVWKKMPAMKAEASWSSSNDRMKFYEGFEQQISGDSIGAYFSFECSEDDEVLVQLGVSYVSIENARRNMEQEQKGKDFNQLLAEAEKTWEDVLSKIMVEGGSEDQKTIFYTALYHMHLHPNVINDVNGEFPEMESYNIGKNESRDRYTVFSLWDTYRNFHPLMSLVYPDVQLDMVRSMIDMYKESGWLPKWELNGMETYTMNGDPAIPVIVDTYLRGLKDFDVETAYEAMMKHSLSKGAENKIRPDHDFYLKHGYMPVQEKYDNSVSVALEYYIADWNVGEFAKALGKEADYKLFNKRSLQYVNYYDSKGFGMLRPKLEDGSFYTPFDPLEGADFAPVTGFHEGTAWQYAFGVPHDIDGLIKLTGGKKKFVGTLQSVFDDGLYDMANEPDIHYPYLFNYVKGEEWRTQKIVSELIDTYFKNDPAGLPGNDDCGTMSAWLVYSMMGFYPVCPGDMDYALTSPVFDRVVIDLDDRYYEGDSVEIVSSKHEGCYNIQEIKLNGKKLPGMFLGHADLVKGGVLEYTFKE